VTPAPPGPGVVPAATPARTVPDAPPSELRYRQPLRLLASARDLWRARELVRALAERQLRVQYKQALLGVAWAVVGPFALMVVFTVFFQRVARVDTGGVPYPLFSYLGLVPWAFFSSSVSQGGQSLIANSSLLNKIVCPRAVFPLSMVAVAGVDALVSIGMLAVLFGVMTFVPRPTSVWVPLLLLVQVAFTVGVTLVVAALVVYVRDVRHALPMFLQLMLFATPVAYGVDTVPASLRVLYAALNPLVPVIDGYRRAVLLGLPPNAGMLAVGGATALAALVGGFSFFRRLEAGFADVS
jgi:ABC-type polysaccharide/polyol phosphate export permease